MSKLTRNSIVQHMESNSLFTISQHGFHGKHSCTIQLLEVMDNWVEHMKALMWFIWILAKLLIRYLTKIVCQIRILWHKR